MFNLNGLNFNIDYDLLNKAREDTGTTVSSMSEQADYIPSDYYVDLFADTTAPLVGTLTPNVGDMFAPLELPSFDLGFLPQETIAPPEPIAAPVVQNQDIAQLILQMAVGSATPDLQYDFNGDGRITSYDALQYAKGAQAPTTSTQTVAPTVAPTTVTQDFSPPPSLDIGQREEITTSPTATTTPPTATSFVPEGLYGGQSTNSAANDAYLATVANEPLPEGVTLADLQQSDFIQGRIQDAVDVHNKIESIGDSTIGKIAKVAGVAVVTGGLGNAVGAATGLSSAAGAGIVNAGATLAAGGDIEDAVKTGLLTYAGGELGSRVQAGTEFGINPLGEQAGMLAEQSWGIGGFSPVAAAAGSMVDSAIRTGTLDPTKLISGAVVSEFGAPQLVADAVDFTKAYVEDDYASMLGIASDYVDLPSGDGLSFNTPDFLKEFDKQVLQPAKEIIKEVGSGIYEAQKPVGQAIADVGEVVYEDLVKPLGNAVTDVAQVIDDEVIDPFVSTIQDSVIDPIEEAAQAVYEEQKPIGQAIADTVEAVVEPIGDVAETVYEAQKPIGQAIADTGEVIYEDILKPVGNTIVDVGETVYEAQKPIGQAIADTGETIYEAQKPIGQAIADTGEVVYEDIIKPIGTAIDDNIIDPIDQVLRDIEVPEVDLPSVDIDLPDIDLPSIDLPSIDWKGLFGSLLGFGGMMSAAAQGPTAKPSQDINIREFEDFKFTPYRSKLSPKASTLGRRV